MAEETTSEIQINIKGMLSSRDYDHLSSIDVERPRTQRAEASNIDNIGQDCLGFEKGDCAEI